MQTDQQKLYAAIIALVVILGGAGGYWLYQQSHKTTNTDSQATSESANNRFPGGPGGQRGMNGGGSGQFSRANMSQVSGTLKAKTSSSLTIETDSGNTTVTISDSTRFNKSSNGEMAQLALSDLAVGDKVSAMGEKNSSGTITAGMVFIGDMPTPPQDRTEGSTDSSSSSTNSI